MSAATPDADRQRVSLVPARDRVTMAWSLIIALAAVGSATLTSVLPLSDTGPDAAELARELDRFPLGAFVFLGPIAMVFLGFGFVPPFRRRGLAVEPAAEEIWYERAGRRILLPWRDIAGVGFALAPAPLWAKLSIHLPEPVFAAEIYLWDPQQVAELNVVRRHLTEGEPGYDRVPGTRLSFGQLDHDQIDRLARAVCRDKPRRWLDRPPD